MSWVSEAREALSRGEAVVVRPEGGSMRGRIESGQQVTIVAHLQGERFIDLHLPIAQASAVVLAEPGRLLIDEERFSPRVRKVWEIACR